MATAGLARRFTGKRLGSLLAVIFVALAVPTGALVWQAYSQLKWESFHQHRNQAESLTARIDARLIDLVTMADSRAYADYSFLVVAGDPSANFLQRSTLAAFPVRDALPGVIGYFQVGSDGEFSTPLLPAASANTAQLGVSRDELAARQNLASEIQQILVDNRLVQSRPAGGLRTPSEVAETAALSGEEEKELPESADDDGRTRQLSSLPQVRAPSAVSERGEDVARRSSTDEQIQQEMAGTDRQLVVSASSATASAEPYSQQVFDELNRATRPSPAETDSLAATDFADFAVTLGEAEERGNAIAKVSDIKLDEELQKKSENAAQQGIREAAVSGRSAEAPARNKRREQTALPQSDTFADRLQSPAAGLAGDVRINTFESELDPFEFSLLDSGHFVLFRKVWRNGERLIQGILLDQNTFFANAIDTDFFSAALSAMSNLIIAYQDDVIHTISGGDDYQIGSSPASLDGALLYRSRLSAPLDRLELIYSIKSLPAGPGAAVIAWVTFVLALVFVGGFIALYRLGAGQIRLANQQQDFVSAVSHELKTPLTSIRMYGEMLKEGWADEDKRQSYYEYIHEESERLTRMITNVLQLANISKHEPVFELKPTSVDTLMAETLRKLSGHVQRSGFDLAIDVANGLDTVSVDIDEDCFAQIVINLVDNAIKFSRNADRKTIDLSCVATAEDAVVIAVRDYGPGIPKDQLKKIFRLFYRSENELTRETVGTGIGLAIVQQLTTGMNGKVDVENCFPGTRFSLSFPISTA